MQTKDLRTKEKMMHQNHPRKLTLQKNKEVRLRPCALAFQCVDFLLFG